jgi:hypothetical protein
LKKRRGPTRAVEPFKKKKRSVEGKNSGAIIPLPHTSSWRSAQLIERRNNFTKMRRTASG